MRALMGWVCAVWLVPALAMGQPLADRVPDDAILYIGWAGTDALAAPYQGTHLQGIMEHSQIPELVDRTLPSLIERLRQEDSDTADNVEQFASLIRTSGKYPIAFYLRDFANADSRPGDNIAGTVLIDAGDEAADLAQRLTDLQKPGSANTVRHQENLVIVSPRGDVLDAPAPLSADARFIHAAERLQDQPAWAVYVNVRAVRDLITRAAELQAPGEGPADPGPAAPPQLLIPLHLLQGIDSAAFSAGFDGKMWRTQAFIAAPAPRRGLAALFEADPISDDLLRAIPRSAEWVAIRRLDLAKLHDQIRDAFAIGMNDDGAMFDQGMGAATMGLGANPKTMLFDPLGDEWAVYVAPDVGGDSFLGGVLLNRVDDPARIQRGLSSIAIAATNIATGQMRGQMSLRLAYAQHDGTRISYLNTPFITPAWAVKDDLLVMGLFPQTVAGALDAAGSEGSILDNETFVRMRAELGEHPATSIGFVDLEKTAVKAYPTLLMWAQLYGGGADLFVDDVPPILIPTLPNLLPHLMPAGRAAWVDEQGWHARMIAPFPMHGLLAGEFSQIVEQFSLFSPLTMPVTMAGGEAKQRNTRLGNLRQILLAMTMYSLDHRGQLPPDLATLWGEYLAVDLAVFTSPGRSRPVPVAIVQGTREQQTAWITEHSAYVLIRPNQRLGDLANPAQVIVIHERIEDRQPTDRIAVGYADGHAVSLTVAELQQHLAEQEP